MISLLETARYRRTVGLTLIELLIAIAIVSVIASIAMPLYNNYREEAEMARVIKDIKLIEMELNDYVLGGNLPNTLADIGVDRIDPWGNPYQYLPIAVTPPPNTGKVRKDKNLHPINTDYDLCSMGPDGKTATQLTSKNARDDIIRAANGAFVGRAEDY